MKSSMTMREVDQNYIAVADLQGERVTNCKVFWKIPNDYYAVAASIDRGSPIVLQERSEVGRSYRGLAAKLVGESSRWGFPSPVGDEGPEGAEAAGIAVKRPRSPNWNSGSAAARLG
jgi:hypothetical protein